MAKFIPYFAGVMVLLFVGGVKAGENDQIYDSHSFDRMIIKNRARLQKEHGAYEDTAVYQYCDDRDIQREIKEQSNNKGGRIDLCTVNIDGNTKQKKVRVAVETNREIVVNDAEEVNIGTIDVNTQRGRTSGLDIGTYDSTRGGITVRGRYGQ